MHAEGWNRALNPWWKYCMKNKNGFPGYTLQKNKKLLSLKLRSCHTDVIRNPKPAEKRLDRAVKVKMTRKKTQKLLSILPILP
jgi:hypothetical protein